MKLTLDPERIGLNKQQPLQYNRWPGRDYIGAKTLVSNPAATEWLLEDRGDDADWFRAALVNMGIKPCIPWRKSRRKAIKYDK
jgi:hypothetical protein